jgi:hypothetical protein
MKIIGISGRKQSGKNTIANYINGDVLLNRQMINNFYIDLDGKLIISTENSDGQTGYGEFDVTRKDEVFVNYAERDLWPYIKVYHFADPLKEMSVNLFGLNAKNIYGSDEDKNQATPFLWKDMPGVARRQKDLSKNMTHREFLEFFGTNIIRKIKNNAWSEFTIKRIISEKPEIAIIPDVRFPNEVESIKNNGGIVIRLTRDVFSSDSESEAALDKNAYNWDNFDTVIDNQNMSLGQLCEYLKANYFMWRN